MAVKRNPEIEEFAKWCMGKCPPGHKGSCVYRMHADGNWLHLKKKCPKLKDKKVVK